MYLRVISNSFILKLCIMIVHTLKMCTRDAGPEQSLVLLKSVVFFFYKIRPYIVFSLSP